MLQNDEEHLASMDYLRKGIHLRGYAQKDPKNEYKREAFEMFNDMLSRLKHETVTVLARGRVRADITEEAREDRRRQMENLDFQHAEAASAAEQAAAAAQAQPEGASEDAAADEVARANLPGTDAPAERVPGDGLRDAPAAGAERAGVVVDERAHRRAGRQGPAVRPGGGRGVGPAP